MTLPSVCILAGGLGTRLGALVADTPKPLLEVAGRPFLTWQLELLEQHGATNVYVCVGYLGERIAQAVGPRYGSVSLHYRFDPPGLAGTAGAIRAIVGELGDRFLVLYGDTYLQIDYAAVVKACDRIGKPALMTVLENHGQWDTSNAAFDGTLVHYDKKLPRPGMTWIDYGLGVLTSAALDVAPDASDLADVYAELSRRGQLAGFAATERFYEIGTPEALRATAAVLMARAGRSR